jgi:hypothetical protein
MRSGTVIDRVSSINDLGAIMDEKMIFSEHVDVIVAKAFAMLGFISTSAGIYRSLYSEVSVHNIFWFVQSWSIRKLRVKPVL